MSQEWCTIESDPGVFSELISLFGVKGVAVEEVYSIDSVGENVDDVTIKTFGYIFLFKWKKELQNDGRTPCDPFDCPNLFFARQIATNACATQAILAVLLNSTEIELGDSLQEFKTFTAPLDSESKGFAIGNFDKIRIAHNSFTRPDPFIVDHAPASSSDGEDPYHFVAYVPFDGHVYEIDGLRSGPFDLGTYDATDPTSWHAIAQPSIEARMGQYGASETHFSLLRICQKRSAVLESIIGNLREQVGVNMAVEGDQSIVDSELSQKITRYSELLEEELLKERKHSEENVRRRHNYVPLILELLNSIGRAGKLDRLIESAGSHSGAQADRK